MFNRLGREKGFTLIEMMIVVAILGILASLAVPNYMKFSAKAKQVEAKSNLSTIFTAQLSYFYEHDSFGTTFNSICWSPMGITRYEYFLTSGETTGSLTGLTMPAGVAVSQTAFTSGATGNIDSETNSYDIWTINDKKQLTNITNDITSG